MIKESIKGRKNLLGFFITPPSKIIYINQDSRISFANELSSEKI